MLKINRENLKSSHQLIWFIIDFLMLGLLIINLAFIKIGRAHVWLGVWRVLFRAS